MAGVSTATVSRANESGKSVNTDASESGTGRAGLVLFLSWPVTHYQTPGIPHYFSDHPRHLRSIFRRRDPGDRAHCYATGLSGADRRLRAPTSTGTHLLQPHHYY
ncbi:hypothetical protein M5J15_13665 [Serratia symbiotica]|nr:hypothetical protein M5J15_13665 [Serratia symbiotica]